MNITNLKIAESKQEQSTSQFRQSLLDAEKEINDPLVQCQTSKQQIEFGKQKISILNETVHKTEF